MKSKWMIIIIVVVALAVIGTTVGVSLAVWRSRPVTEQDVPLPIDDYNPSEKHFVYHALDGSGNFTNGTASSYAVVGYNGLVDV
ncbi:MAG: hypothetical protein J5755_04725, partial [Clostridia bacterium]|nr:hypothetical protein [Clostridia bacterium]